MAFKSKKRFEYKPRDPDAVRARAASGGNREGFLVDGVKTFSPKAGEHTVRFLPPTWDSTSHYGFDLWAHYGVGYDSGSYLCLQKMNKGDCALCRERQRAIKDDDEELAKLLEPRSRVACWVIDRDNERDGVLMWLMPWTVDREILQQSMDKKTKEVYNVDDPEKGYDVSFERQGERMTTKYVGVQLDRRPSPLTDDDELAEEWLNFVQENPIPDQLIFQEEEYLEKIVGDGLVAPKSVRDKTKKDKEEDEKPSRKRPRRDEEEDETPRRSRRGKQEEDEEEEKPSRKAKGNGKDKEEIDVAELDWAAVHKMDEDELTALAEQEDIDISDADDETEAADIICKKLRLKEEKEDEDDEPKKSARPTMGNKISALRGRRAK